MELNLNKEKMKSFKILLILASLINLNIKTINFDKIIGTIGISNSIIITAYLLKMAKLNFDVFKGKKRCHHHADSNDNVKTHYRLMKENLIFCVPTIFSGIISYRLLKRIL